MHTLTYLEMPITHICSLHCDGCSAYSNYNIKRTVPLDEARAWMRAWSARLTPGEVRVLGGEPFLHPHLPEIILAARQFWPTSHIQLCTNGLNLDRHPMVAPIMALPNMSIHLSIHSTDEAYQARLQKGLNTLARWMGEYGLKVQAGNNTVFWNRFYKGIGKSMQPFEGQPLQSWKVCHSKRCCNLLENRLWKCPQIGNLHLVADRFELHKNPAWAKYLAYPGIGLEATDEDLAAWLRARNGPESICDMCPTTLDHYEKDIYNINYTLPNITRVAKGDLKKPEPAAQDFEGVI